LIGSAFTCQYRLKASRRGSLLAETDRADTIMYTNVDIMVSARLIKLRNRNDISKFDCQKGRFYHFSWRKLRSSNI